MNTQQWTLVIYDSEQDWKIDDGEKYAVKTQYRDKEGAITASKIAVYHGYWTRIFAPDGELLG